MMTYQAILFDLDGTLLPMDTEAFTQGYFRLLAKAVAPLGITPEAMISALWSGIRAMMVNDGRRSNRERFWEVFSAETGVAQALCEPICDRFYTEGFHQARAFTGDNPLAVEAMRLARQKADKVILATNPLFPLPGQTTRMSWVGLRPSDFDLVTSYEGDRFCKPNPAYYQDICDRLSLDPARCLMIGNDEREDMLAAHSLGMAGYLVTDCLLPCPEHPWDGPRGTFADMTAMLRRL